MPGRPCRAARGPRATSRRPSRRSRSSVRTSSTARSTRAATSRSCCSRSVISSSWASSAARSSWSSFSTSWRRNVPTTCSARSNTRSSTSGGTHAGDCSPRRRRSGARLRDTVSRRPSIVALTRAAWRWSRIAVSSDSPASRDTSRVARRRRTPATIRSTAASSSTASMTVAATATARAATRSALAGCSSHAPRRSTCAGSARRSRTWSSSRKFSSTKVARFWPSPSLDRGMTAVCGIGTPSGWRNSATTANQSASPPTRPASSAART